MRRAALLCALCTLVVLASIVGAAATTPSESNAWLKQDPPNDVDKWNLGVSFWYEDANSNGKWDRGEDRSLGGAGEGWTEVTSDGTCWMAAAANILGCAGWGDEKDIYEEMVAEYCGPGLPQWRGGDECDAVNWYLNRQKNPDGTWTDKKSCYTAVRSWTRADMQAEGYTSGAEFIADQLRQCQYVTLGIYDVTRSHGHAVTAWGDTASADWKTTDADPGWLWIADSDDDDAWSEHKYDKVRDLQPFKWTSAWELSYSGRENVWDACTLCPSDVPEPATWVLLACTGVVGLLKRRRK